MNATLSHIAKTAERHSLSHLREMCLRFNPSHVKQANLGGEQEAGFEQAFSSLAYAYLKDKAPKLLDFIVGFQLVDRNEDNTKAVGIFGFKMGDQWLYAPVFFLNGDLKGHELLYIKKQDAFVPMKENWVNYLMARKPHVLGERSTQDTYQLGGLAPNIEQLSWPPEQSKFGCDDWAKPVMPLVAACAVKKAGFLWRGKDGVLSIEKVGADPFKAAFVGQTMKLNEFLGSSVHLARGAHSIAKQFPGIKQAFDKLYGHDYFQKLAFELKASEQARQSDIVSPAQRAEKRAADAAKPRRINNGSLIPEFEKNAVGEEKLKVVVKDDVGITQNLPDLDGEDQGKLLSHGYLVKDERSGEEVTKAYNTQTRQTLDNPKETGIYQILEKPGSFSRMLVISNPVSNKGGNNYVTVVRLSDGNNKAWMNGHRNAVWSNSDDIKADEFRDWHDDQSDKDTLKKGGTYVAVSGMGEGTVPFRVLEVHGEGSYKVDFKTHEDYGAGRPGFLPRTEYSEGMGENDGPYISTYNATLIVNKRPDSSLKALSGDLHVPDTFKFIQLKPPPKPKKRDDDGYLIDCCEPCDGDNSEPDPIQPGDIADIQLLFTEKTSRMKIYADHHEFTISTEKRGSERLSGLSAMLCLVRDHGLREKTAKDLLAEAQRKGGQIFRVKYAFGYPHEAVGPGVSAPQFPAPELGSEQVGYGQVPSIYPQEEFMPVEGMQSDMTDPKIYDPFMMPDQNAVGMAQQAGESGQKEVFDTAMIGGMLKAVRQDSLVDRYLGDLMKGLDKLGRILFMFYWHQEEFEDRYGKQDLPELEDSIRNAFETLGDVVLFLKEKTIEPSLGDEMGQPDIEEAARN